MNNTDTYCYPNEDVLINRFNCHDKDNLSKLEAIVSGYALLNLQLHPISGVFDFKHLKKIHHAIFKDIYDWAGKSRTVDIGKGNLFCRVQFIDSYAKAVFENFYSDCHDAKDIKSNFIKVLAKYYSDMNALHPFREGNGRSQREFTRELCHKCGYMLDFTRTNHKEMLDSSIASFNNGDLTGFTAIFEKCIIPLTEYKDIQKELTSKFLTLSIDDINRDTLTHFPGIKQ